MPSASFILYINQSNESCDDGTMLNCLKIQIKNGENVDVSKRTSLTKSISCGSFFDRLLQIRIRPDALDRDHIKSLPFKENEITNSEKEMSLKRKTLITTLKNVISSSSLHFFFNPVRSKRLIMKIIWIVFLLTAVILTSVYLTKEIVAFLNYQVVTFTYQIDEKQSEFPTVSFCGQEKDLTIRVGSVWFNDEDLVADWQNHFEIYNDSAFGMCFRFNSGRNMFNQSIPIKYSKRGGWQSGFAITFESYTPFNHGTIYAFIHNNTMIPSTIYNRGVPVHSGSDNYFSVKRTLNKKLALPFNNCLKNVDDFHLNKEIINYIKNKNWKYTKKECMRLCTNLIFNETNDCSCHINQIDEDLWYKCYDFEKDVGLKNCFIEEWAKISNQDKCISEYCPSECDTFTYEISSTSISYPVGNSLFFKRFFSMTVFYEDLSYTLIDQLPKIEHFELISNIGGTLGVFLSSSFVTFVELFEVLTELVLFISNRICKHFNPSSSELKI